MTQLLQLRLTGSLRAVLARPVWLTVSALLLGSVLVAAYAAVSYGTRWVKNYPLIESIAPAVIQRSLEGMFLVLMATVLFSVLIASIGIIYGSQDLEFLLAQPVRPAQVFGLKVAELFVNAAGLPLLFTLPVLAGIGVALDASVGFYVVSFVATVALYALPVTAGALLALLLVRISPAGRVKEVATAVSIAAAAAALLGVRALRPEQLLNLDLADGEAFEVFLTAFTRLEIGWLPPAWAGNASWAALDGQLHPALLALLLLGSLGMVMTAGLSRLAFARGWVRSIDTQPVGRRLKARKQPWWERQLVHRLGTVGAILVRDVRGFFRDVQQWSQLIVLLALAGVYFVSLSAIPVPNQQFSDAVGGLNVAFMAFITAGVGLRIAFPTVSLEGNSYWLSQTQPVRAREIVLAKFLLVLPLMLLLGLVLGAAAIMLLDLGDLLAVASLIAALCSAVAFSGLAVGLGAAQPVFNHSNPNELAMSPAAFTYMGFALLFGAVITILLARPAWSAISAEADATYFLSPEGLVLLAAVLLLTAVTTLLPLWHGVKQLDRFEQR